MKKMLLSVLPLCLMGHVYASQVPAATPAVQATVSNVNVFASISNSLDGKAFQELLSKSSSGKQTPVEVAVCMRSCQ